MMIKKVLAIATALAMTISMASYQSYNAEAADNIYETREVFVADSIIKGTLDKNGNVLNSYSAVSNTIAREYTYKTLAEALIDNKTLVFDSSFWLNLDNALDGNFKSVFKQREVFYETVLMDYLLYGDNSGENTKTFDSETANNFYKISKKLINEANDTYEDNLDDIIANQSLSDAIEFSNKYGFINELNGFTKITDSIKNSVTTAKQYYDRLASALTIKNACVNRVEFLKKIKANSSDNTELCTAIDNLVKKYESGYASLLFNKFVNDAVKDLSDYVWGKVLTEVPGLKELKMGVGKLDEIFKSKDLATCNLNLLFVYIINSKAMAATTSLRSSFNDNKNTLNGYSFINGYMEYVNYQKYATTVAKSYVNTAKSASPGTSYSALEKSITDDDSMSDSYLRLINTYYNLHDKYYGELTKTVDSGTTDEMNWSLNGKGTLTISGKGDMKYYYYSDRPWHKYKDKIKKVVVEDGITSISSKAFYDCPNLTEVSIANTVTNIESSAFSNCTSLKSISFPSNVTKLGDYVLNGCTSLENVSIPGSVTEIGDYAFNGCTSLKSITLPSSITSIGNSIFNNSALETARVYKNSYPLTYCKNNNINYQIIGSFDKATSIQVSNGSCTNIDDNTELKASQVKTGTDYDSVSQSFDNFNLYDIAFYKDDEKVTIDGTAIVRIPVGENMNIDKCKVYYNDNGNYVDMNAVYKEGYMEFETTHFSQYIITDTPLETESDLTVGDVNNDGKVNVLDAVMVLRHDANIIKLDDSQLKAADVNDDGKADVLDAVMILRYEAGIIKSFN